MGFRAIKMGLRASWRGLRANWMGLRAGLRGLRASWSGLRASQQGLWASQRGGGWGDGLEDGQTEFLPILQDFVPCWGRCPATLCNFTTSKRKGKGTADLMMPFGVLLFMKVTDSYDFGLQNY